MYKKTLELLNCIPPLDVNKTENVGTKLKISQRRQTTTAKCPSTPWIDIQLIWKYYHGS